MAENKSRDKIIEETFKLLLKYPADKITVPILEEATGLTRGSLFYYFEDKEDLFRETMKYYSLAIRSAQFRVDPKVCGSFREYIDFSMAKIQKMLDTARASGIEHPERTYLAFLFRAVTDYEGFDKIVLTNIENERKEIAGMLSIARERGEIRQDVDVDMAARQFRYIYVGMITESAAEKGIDLSSLKKLYLDYYNYLKS